MRRIIIFLSLIASLLLVSPARAQGNQPRFSVLEIDIWPEYDQPTALVIYRITLAPTIALPADITVRIPAAAGTPHAVAAKQVDGTLINLTYKQQISGNWSVIRFTASTPELEVDYYDPGLSKQGTSRHYEYNWPGDYAIDSLMLDVLEPIGATDMRITPNLGGGTVQDGLTYYAASQGSLSAGQTFKITLDYQKSSDTLTIEKLKIEPSQPISDNTTGRANLLSWAATLFGGSTIWIFGLIGAALIFGGIFWYVRAGQMQAGSTLARRRHAPSQAKEKQGSRVDTSDEEGILYCHQCGKRASSGDRFCRACGVKLRVE